MAGEGAQEWVEQGQDCGEGGERVARQADDAAAVGEDGEQHRVAWAAGDAADQDFGVEGFEHAAEVVRWAYRGGTAGDQDV